MIEAVTFDFWNTMIATPGDDLVRVRAEHWTQVLADAGHDVTHDQLGEAFHASWASFQEAWKENRQYTTPEAVRRVLEVLDLSGEEELAEVLVQDYEAGRVESDLEPTPNIGHALETLKAAGVKVGIICDVGMTPSVALRATLDRFGLLQHVDHHSFSDDVGTYKPDPKIFAHALDGLGTRPEATAHVGDLRRTDVAGANAAGWTSVRYAGIFDDDGVRDEVTDVEADHVIHDHADLAGVLGIS
ncbi:MAG TPA: HAD family hydrolase [Acidimicrobiales bacterium]|nr:HAD family hydrolase [Acidimicrobiales bacterium]